MACPNCGFIGDPTTGRVYDVTYPCPNCGQGGAVWTGDDPEDELLLSEPGVDELKAMRVARRFLADTLTKSWLLKVKKGWKAVIQSNHATANKVIIIRDFLKKLREQIIFQKHGLHLVFEGKERDQFEDLLAKTNKKLDELEKQYYGEIKAYQDADLARQEAWLDIEDKTGDNPRKSGGMPDFIQRHPDFEPVQKRFMETMGVADKWSYYPEKSWAPVTKRFEELMTFLYAEAKARAEYEAEHGPLYEDLGLETEKVFDLEGIKVVVIDDDLSRVSVKGYIKHLDHAHQLLAQKRLGKVWHGVVFVEGKYHKMSPDEAALAKEYGYNSSESSGVYHQGPDRVYIQQPSSKHVVETMVHELGHRYWFKYMRPEQRARFNDLVQTKASEKYRDYPQGPKTEEGEDKPVTPVSDYGASNIEEAFAEAFAHYVLEEDMNRDQLESFRSVMSSTDEDDAEDLELMAECGCPLNYKVASRYLVARGYFEQGDYILFGKFKNKPGKIVRLYTDDRGVPTVDIDPIPKGRKKTKTMGLFKFWHLPKERLEEIKAKEVEEKT